MIIKKQNFKLTPGFSAKDWPFNVSEVAVLISVVKNPSNENELLKCFCIVHNLGIFALSGIMESYGVPNLEAAGIWAEATGNGAHCIPAPRKSLSPFFKYLEWKINGNDRNHEQKQKVVPILET